MMTRFKEKLQQLEAHHRLRSLKLPGGIDLTSNDYLGMREHEALRAAALEALGSGMDIGAGGSRLLRGHTAAHAELEGFAARYFGTEKSLYFATGFQANTAIFKTLPDRRDTIVFDELIHASARDGIQAAHARHIKIRHNDLDGFENALKKAQQDGGDIWMAVEALYSMDGDTAPLSALSDLAQKYGAWLIVDEAHATGVMGQGGKGLAYELPKENLITLHTCGKAIGVAGGLVCGPADVIDYMINAARAFIYSTAPLPLQAHLVQKSLEILAGDDGTARREKLAALCVTAHKVFGGHGTHIVPVMLGEDERALETAGALQRAGYDIRAIRPPTVPEGTARLRLSLGTHLDEEILHNFSAALMPLLQGKAA